MPSPASNTIFKPEIDLSASPLAPSDIGSVPSLPLRTSVDFNWYHVTVGDLSPHVYNVNGVQYGGGHRTPLNTIITFQASITYPPGEDPAVKSNSTYAIVEYLWNFGDGSYGRGATVKHAYSVADPIQASLIAIDLRGRRSSVGHPLNLFPNTLSYRDQLALRETMTRGVAYHRSTMDTLALVDQGGSGGSIGAASSGLILVNTIIANSLSQPLILANTIIDKVPQPLILAGTIYV